jgi:hypothetical protein
VVHDEASIHEWEEVHREYAARTQELWKDGWFRDFDTRSMQIVTSVPPDPAQSAPAFCGVATEDQKEQMRPVLRKFYDDSRSRGQNPAQGWDDGLAWSSIVLPYVESIWAANDGALASQVVHTIAERIYVSMDRHKLNTETSATDSHRLGWPGVSCEIWGAHGAFGGEGYGWGAVMPAHIIRTLIGIRETDDPTQLWICPSLPEPFLIAGKQYGISGLHHASRERFDLSYKVLDGRNLLVTGNWSGLTRILFAIDSRGEKRTIENNGTKWQFQAMNNERYLFRLEFVPHG